ncbi:hypothetical protein THAOC_30900, partial [Thalassiosira oceanica]
ACESADPKPRKSAKNWNENLRRPAAPPEDNNRQTRQRARRVERDKMGRSSALLGAVLLLAGRANTFSTRPPIRTRHPHPRTSTPAVPISSSTTARRRCRGLHSSLIDGGGAGTIAPFQKILEEKLPSQKIIDAAESFGGRPIVASDLAAKAGVSISQARKDLTALATLTRGDIAVSNDGDLIYTFPRDIGSVIASTSAKYRALSTWNDKLKEPLFYATKVGFGVALLASLVAIYSTIFFIGSSSSSDRDDRDDRRGYGGGGGGMPMGFGGFWGPSPFDFFYYRPYYSRYYYSPAYDTGGRRRDPDEMGFLESVFSYVFGDGNPNGDVEERRLGLAAEMIRMNGGAVTAEQLAPFVDEAPAPLDADGRLGEERAYVDEAFVLPIVTQLDGEPQVTEDGDIVYTFPELMTTSTSKGTSSVSREDMARIQREGRILQKAGLEKDAPSSTIKTLLTMNRISTRGALSRSDLIDILADVLPGDDDGDSYQDVDDPTILVEREHKFSLASGLQTVLAGALGVVNLGGALYLGNLLGQYALYGVRLPSYMGLVQQFFPLLLGYAVLFNLIPLARNFWIQKENAKIQQRNETRLKWRNLLENGAGNVKRKLTAARKFGSKMKRLGTGSRDVIFDTSKDFAEVERVKESNDLDAFDEKLRSSSSSSSSSWE